MIFAHQPPHNKKSGKEATHILYYLCNYDKLTADTLLALIKQGADINGSGFEEPSGTLLHML